MNRFLGWLTDGIRFLAAEFMGQIIAAVILFAAFVAWAYFSSIYATIPVIAIGIIAWGAASKLFQGKNTKDRRTDSNQSR